MPKGIKKIKPVESPKSADYEVHLECGGKSYDGQGKTLLEAISAVKPGNVKMLKGTITIKHGMKKVEKFLAIRQMYKLWGRDGGLSAEMTRIAVTKYLNLFIK